MFKSLEDAKQRRDQQNALDVLRASQIYEQMRKDNPRMLQPNMVDFSNPESVSTIMNPYGTYNPYANPNIGQQNPGYNPYAYLSPSYSNAGTWYGYSNVWGLNDTARFMIASQEDIDAGRLTTAKVIQVPIEETTIEKKEEYTGLTYEEKIRQGLQNLQVRVVEEVINKEVDTSHTPKVITIRNIKPHADHMGFDNDELDMTKHEMKVIADSPLNWSERDEQELSDISDQIAVYDKALAHTLWNIPTFENISREDWYYFRRYALDKLQDFRNKERMNPNIDYRAPYRYRPLPAVYKDKDGEIIPDLSVPAPVAVKSINITGEVVYAYDRCRDTLTDEEWDVFVDRAFFEMLSEAKKMKSEDLINLNKGILNQETPKNQSTQTQLPSYNPNDPISVRLYQIKYAEQQYNNHKQFYRDVFRSTMTDEQFDAWWYGTTTAINRQMSQAESQRAWARSMTDLSIQELNKVQVIDPVQSAQYYNNLILNALNNFTKGSMRPNMTAKEAWDNIGYLNSRIHELNMQEQKKQEAQQYYQNMSRDTFQKSLYQYMNAPGFNPNPNYTSQYGTIDPRFGLPSNYVDLTNTPEVQAKRERFLNYCNNTTGQAPLSPIYR